MEFKAFFVIAILFLIIPVMADTETYYSSSDIVTYPAAKNITFGEIINTSATGSSTTSTTLVSLMANYTPGTNNFSQLRRYVTTFNDTGSCIPASARIKIWSISKTSGLGTTGFGITAVNATPAGFPVVYSDYKKVGHLRYSNIISYADLPTANWMTLELNSDGMAALTADGNFSLALVSTWDANMSFTGTWASNGTNTWLANQSSAAGTIFDPYLEITCEAAPTPIPTVTPSSDEYPICEDMNFFFWNDSSSFGDDYNRLATKPQMSDAVILSAVVSDVTGEQTIGSFITEPFPTGKIMGPGLTRYRTYLNVSSAVGTTKYDFIPYNVSPSGIETKMFFGIPRTEEINSLTVDEYLTSYARRNYTTFLPGERLLIRVNASTTSSVERTAYFNIAGTEAASMVGVGYWICPDPTIRGPEINPPSPDSFIGTAKLWIKKFIKDVFE